MKNDFAEKVKATELEDGSLPHPLFYHRATPAWKFQNTWFFLWALQVVLP
jgi:hypothetical protein